MVVEMFSPDECPNMDHPFDHQCALCGFQNAPNAQHNNNHQKEGIMPDKYRKKPVVIEAVQFTGDDTLIFDFIGVHRVEVAPNASAGHVTVTAILIDTLEGTMRADVGDYIIRGVQGEFYPCKPDIFAATYEKVGV